MDDVLYKHEEYCTQVQLPLQELRGRHRRSEEARPGLRVGS